MVGYNVQPAVDTQHHLIVTPAVVNEGHDRSQLSPCSVSSSAATSMPK
jgi:transposase